MRGQSPSTDRSPPRPHEPGRPADYAEYLLVRRDTTELSHVLRRLSPADKNTRRCSEPDEGIYRTGDPEEALALGSIRARKVARPSNTSMLWKKPATTAGCQIGLPDTPGTKDPDCLRKSPFNCLSRYDIRPHVLPMPPMPTCAGLRHPVRFYPAPEIAGDYTRALDEAEILLSRSQDPVSRLVRVDLLAALGRLDRR